MNISLCVCMHVLLYFYFCFYEQSFVMLIVSRLWNKTESEKVLCDPVIWFPHKPVSVLSSRD